VHVLATDPAGITTAIATSATAVVGLMVYYVSHRSHALERAKAGIKGALGVTPAPKVYRPPSSDAFAELPPGWAKDNTRYCAIRLHNHGPYPVKATMWMAEAHLGHWRRLVETEGHLEIVLNTNDPQTQFLLLHKRDGWKSTQIVHRRLWVTVTTSIDTIHFRKRVWVKPIPEPGSGGWAVPDQGEPGAT
jgi:hypothetical protein